MKKKNLMPYLALGITFVLFNAIAFVVPTEKTATFWTTYAFSIVAFATQISLWKIAFGKQDTLKSKFTCIPIIHIGITYLIVQSIAFAFFMFLPTLPVWLAVIVCAIILSIFAICVIAGKAGVNEINRIEGTIKAKHAFIQFLQIDIEMIAENETDTETKTALKKLAEKVRFSDPMSHEMLGELESRVSAKVEELKKSTDKKALIEQVDMMLTEYNKKCKAFKEL